MLPFLAPVHSLRGQHATGSIVLQKVQHQLPCDPPVAQLFLQTVNAEVIGLDPGQLPQAIPIDVVVHLPLHQFLEQEEPLERCALAPVLAQETLDQF